MLSLAEISTALYGSWRLAHFDVNGMRYFDQSLEGFWRSFRVAVLAAPFTALLIAVNLADMKVAGGWLRIAIGESLAYVIGWVAFPLAAFYLTEAIDRRAQYLGFITVYNWSGLLQIAVVLPVALISHGTFLPAGLSGILGLAANIAILVYEWFIVRTALSLPGLGAAGIVALDVVISLLVQHAGDLMAQAT